MIVQALTGRPDPRGRRGRSYLLFDPASRQAAVVDPGADRRGVRAFLEAHGAVLTVVATTGDAPAGHRHAREVAEEFGARWLAPALSDAGAGLADPGAALSDSGAGLADGLAVADAPAAPLGRHTLQLRVAPVGGGALVVGPSCLFTGQALLAGEIPPEAEPAHYRARAGWLRQVLGGLPARTRIYPGHGPVSEVGLERTCNQELWG